MVPGLAEKDSLTGELGLSKETGQQFRVTKAEKLVAASIKGDSKKSNCDTESGYTVTQSKVCEMEHSKMKDEQLVTRQMRGGQITDFERNFFARNWEQKYSGWQQLQFFRQVAVDISLEVRPANMRIIE